MDDDRVSILFLCTGNSARSILAEGIGRHRYGHRLHAHSAGSRPRGAVHELALATLRRHGVPTVGLRSKSWDEMKDRRFGLVVTLCDEAAQEACPTFPGAPGRAHWSLPDPPAADEPGAVFEAVYEMLVEAIGQLAEAPDDQLVDRAEDAAAEVERRFAV